MVSQHVPCPQWAWKIIRKINVPKTWPGDHSHSLSSGQDGSVCLALRSGKHLHKTDWLISHSATKSVPV